ncbi:hypothetical protein AMK23_26140 [Streptomyces sp. CB02130]|uniref:hypothetical protein n=1 Tax=Streptomyces sp. CB02130 TaxID=1703934 RepID=UPI00093DE42A|nr:hypothetical protein [Streptomyces sp. CB02130]OKJ24322.1 hypothetical protein AMK23_26140 [Streptomyces sp. CB02130]
MSARDDAISWGLPAQQADDVLTRHRAEVLNEAADAAYAEGDRLYDEQGFVAAEAAWGLSSLLRRMANPSKAARMQDAADTLAAHRSPAKPPLKSRLALLLAHVQEHGGDWTTRRVQKLYVAEEQPAPLRVTARKDLHALHAMGWLVVDTTDPGRRVYRLNHAHTEAHRG